MPTGSLPERPQFDHAFERGPEQRLREYKYRCAQSIVFGIPVLFLQYFGHGLGGPESERWVAFFQALLAGWVMYVGAAGMLFEGIVRWRRDTAGDFIVSAVAVVLYLTSAVSVMAITVTGEVWYRPLLFHLSVVLIGVWTGWRWWSLRNLSAARRRIATAPRD